MPSKIATVPASCACHPPSPSTNGSDTIAQIGAQQGGVLTGSQIESAVEIQGSDLGTSHCGPYLGAIAATMVQGEVWRRRFERRAQDILLGGGFGITLNAAPPRERGHWVHFRSTTLLLVPHARGPLTASLT